MGLVKAIIIFFGCGVICASAQDYDVIAWSPDVKLAWGDFKAEPMNGRAAAVTASGITYRFTSESLGNKVDIDFQVTAHFYPNKSWYRPEHSDANILAHEQLHFDISEIFARKMRKRMKQTKFTRNVRREVKKIYAQINKELEAFQNTYDSETNYSRDREQQQLWKNKIATLLENH